MGLPGPPGGGSETRWCGGVVERGISTGIEVERASSVECSFFGSGEVLQGVLPGID